MTTSTVTNLAQPQGPPMLVSKTGKLLIGLIGLLVVAFHWHLIRRMAMIGIEQPDWSHILIIPLISIYYIHLNRQQIMATPRRICLPGFFFIYFGVFGYILGVYPIQNDMVTGYSMILTIFGVALLLLGPAMMRILWFPIAFLVFAIKISGGIWAVIASKMQTIASTGAYIMLQATEWITGISADLSGNTITLSGAVLDQDYPLNVAEACAGMRMLMAFLALGVALAFVFPRAWWQRLVMVLLAAPIAIFVNALRVATLGWLHLVDPELARGDSHLFVGMLMLIPAAGLLMFVGWALDKCLIKPDTNQTLPPPVPFDQDPNEIRIEKRPFMIGLGVAAATLAIATAIALPLFFWVYNIQFPKLFGVLKPYMVTLGSIMLIHLVLTAVIGIAWVMFMSRFKNRFEKAVRHSMLAGVAIGMLVSGVAIKAAVIQITGLVQQKDPVPLQKSIALQFPKQAGQWELLHHEPKLLKSVEDELGTKEYINRWYMNNAAGLSSKTIEAVTVETELGDRLSGWKPKDPKDPSANAGLSTRGNIAKVHVTYYTGMLDTAPHVPDKCWLAAGMQQTYNKVHEISLSRDDYEQDPDHPGHYFAKSTGFDKTVRLPAKDFEATIFSGTDTESGNTTTALYFFLANGKIVASNEDVRFNFSTKDKYSYYCKVEIMFPYVIEPEEVVRKGEVLLRDLLPEVMACLPDWTEVQAGTYPENNSGSD